MYRDKNRFCREVKFHRQKLQAVQMQLINLLIVSSVEIATTSALDINYPNEGYYNGSSFICCYYAR